MISTGGITTMMKTAYEDLYHWQKNEKGGQT